MARVRSLFFRGEVKTFRHLSIDNGRDQWPLPLATSSWSDSKSSMKSHSVCEIKVLPKEVVLHGFCGIAVIPFVAPDERRDGKKKTPEDMWEIYLGNLLDSWIFLLHFLLL
ncbi:hypothetical protein CDAR_568201 [Caerostris darwini]|uniref:Uncharacterized protein n=1 Tax=Caerostris darwini TaxID=1538125 RepID=A0AAV4UTY1_9ARAC|nr:hypothetical protein CDAR_568201 [Caerostris darwini]